MNLSVPNAAACINAGGVVAYPTEAVYGLGCDALNESAVQRILHLKHRDVSKGLLIISNDWARVSAWTKKIPDENLQAALAVWPGPHTWVFPASDIVPAWIRGKHNSVAIRITAHPIAAELCAASQHPLVSTSANLAGESPAMTTEEVATQFKATLDGVVMGDVGNAAKPTPIQDVLTGQWLRY